MKTKAVILESRPQGEPTSDNFDIKDIQVPDLLRNQVKLENICFTVDPYVRGRMNEGKSYMPPFQVGEPLDGGVVGRVVESNHLDFSEGDIVASDTGGWREHSVVEGSGLRKVSDGPLEVPSENFTNS